MAPSPENGSEPKAPDKQESKEGDGVQTSTTSEPLSVIATEHNQQGATAPIEQDPACLSGLDEGQLRALLDEAITYKCPKDREGKSTLFKELLQEAELVEAPPPGPRTRLRSERHHQRPRVSERSTHGGSLQDLAESELFDPTFNFNPKLENYHYHSRKSTGAKKKVSVSARQREGGSLPSNVNANCDRHFLDDVKNKLRDDKIRNERSRDKERRGDADKTTTISPSDNKSKSVRVSVDSVDFDDLSAPCPFIPNPDYLEAAEQQLTCMSDEVQSLLDHDSLDNEYSYEETDVWKRRTNFDEGTELEVITPKIPRVNYTTRAELEINMDGNTIGSSTYTRSTTQPYTQADSTLPFSLLESTPLQLASGYPSVKCIMGSDKHLGMQGPRQIAMLNIPAAGSWPMGNITMASAMHRDRDEAKKSLDENGNSVQSFNSSLTSSQAIAHQKGKRDKPKLKKVDRNVKVLKAEEVAGHRSETNIDELVRFIENKEAPKKNGTVGVKMNKSQLVSKQEIDDKVNKKRTGERKKDKYGEKDLKKSNSLEEMSCSKLEDLTDQNSDDQPELRNKHKKEGRHMLESNDRRSWGEEMYHLDGNDSVKRKARGHVNEVKSEAVSIVSIEPLVTNSIEASEFHVVTKKKKMKKRQSPGLFSEDNRMRGSANRDNYYSNSKGKFPASSFSNDHDMLYLNKYNSPEHRRKSASSMPPSDKSDTSDLDSVHSLPVESTSMKLSLQQISSSSGGTPQASYADIARMANAGPEHTGPALCLSAGMHDRWPCVSVSPPMSIDMSAVTSSCSSTLSQGSVKMSLNNYNFPDLIESCHYYEVQAKKESEKANAVKSDKVKLSKSKSMEAEPQTDQYPALKHSEWSSSMRPAKAKPATAKNSVKEVQVLRENDRTENSLKHNHKYSRQTERHNNRNKQMEDCGNNIDISNRDIVKPITNNEESTSVNCDNQPAVIFLNDKEAEEELTFGFELNEKLLAGELSDSETVTHTMSTSCNSIEMDQNDSAYLSHENSHIEPVPSESKLHNGGSDFIVENGINNTDDEEAVEKSKKRYEAKKFTTKFNYDIVNFVGIAWADVVTSSGVQYFTAH